MQRCRSYLQLVWFEVLYDSVCSSLINCCIAMEHLQNLKVTNSEKKKRKKRWKERKTARTKKVVERKKDSKDTESKLDILLSLCLTNMKRSNFSGI